MTIKPKLLLLGFIILFLFPVAVSGQNAPNRLSHLIKQTNEIFIAPLASGILLSPFEIIQHNRKYWIRNIEMVDTIQRFIGSDTVTLFIQDNQTIIENPGDQFNSRTYIFHKDGRINKIFRGRHLDDQFVYDESGFLIQHGHGGELKQAKREGKSFEWYNVNKGALVYATTFDEKDRLVSLKTKRQYNVEYKLEEYTWKEMRVVSKNTITQYKKRYADTTYQTFEYDSLGLIKSINSRSDKNTRWNQVKITSTIDRLSTNEIRIELFIEDVKAFSITYDQYNNWVELENNNQLKRRRIVYRKKKRKR